MITGLNTPILWLYNTNDDPRSIADGASRARGLSHWEGFGPPEEVDEAHRQTIDRWNVGRELVDFVWGNQPPIYRVMTRSLEAHGHGYLSVEVGHFVREVRREDVPERWQDGYTDDVVFV